MTRCPFWLGERVTAFALAITVGLGAIGGCSLEGLSEGSLEDARSTGDAGLAHDADATPSREARGEPSEAMGAPFTAIRIACGQSKPVTDADGAVWSADEYYQGGTAQSNAGSVSDTASPALYNGQRYGQNSTAFNYTLPAVAGTYWVHLLFEEGYYTDSTVTGTRTFNVAINGNSVLSSFDIYAAAGQKLNAAVTRAFLVTLTTEESIIIAFSAGMADAKVDAIEILPGASADGGH